MATERGSLLTFEPGSRREARAALAPFLLFGAFPTFLDYLHVSSITAPQWLLTVLALSLLGLLLSLFVIGVIKGFPRWFLPYVGLPLSLFSLVVFELVSSLHSLLLMPGAPWLLRQTVYQGLLWIGLLVAGPLVVLIARILPPLRPLYRRLRQDWTLLSFTLYGATLLALLITFDDYAYEEPYKIVAMLLLAAGGWFYLRAARPWQRLLALFIGLTLAMAVTAAGKAILRSSPNWPGSHCFTWQTEAMSTVIMWGWLVVAIFAPVLLGLLPRSSKRLQSD